MTTCIQRPPHAVLYITQYCTSRSIVHHAVLYITQYCTSRSIVHRAVLYITQYCASRSIVHRAVLCITQYCNCTSRVIAHHAVLYITQYCTSCRYISSDSHETQAWAGEVRASQDYHPFPLAPVYRTFSEPQPGTILYRAHLLGAGDGV